MLIQENTEEQHACYVFEMRCKRCVNVVAIFVEQIRYKCTDKHSINSRAPSFFSSVLSADRWPIIKSMKKPMFLRSGLKNVQLSGEFVLIFNTSHPAMKIWLTQKYKRSTRERLSHKQRLNLARINKSRLYTGERRLPSPHTCHASNAPFMTVIFMRPYDFYGYITCMYTSGHMATHLQSHILIYK